MKEMSEKFPAGVEYGIVYDTTVFIQESINAVYHTLFEAIGLVFVVVLVFLQNWRATLIPMIAVPVSLVGTFAVMSMMGFSQQPVLVRPGAGHRHRRRRRHRRRGERGALSRHGAHPAGGLAQSDG